MKKSPYIMKKRIIPLIMKGVFLCLILALAKTSIGQDAIIPINEKNASVEKIDIGCNQDKSQTHFVDAEKGEGFYLKPFDSQRTSLCLGSLLQSDYRYYDYDDEDPEKNKFDLRRVRLGVYGSLLEQYDYKFEYEFQGAGSRNLQDAYLDANLFKCTSFRVGQFKEPFGLEQSTSDKALFLAERSMGYYLTPSRDVGFLVYGHLWNDAVYYGAGLFNGDGPDDSASGDEDSPQFTARIAAHILKVMGIDWKGNFDIQLGGSFSYAPIDKNNVDIHVKTAGLTEFFNVSSNAKFNMIREVDKQTRYSGEVGCTYGPFILMGEYIRVFFEDVKTSADQFDINIDHYYTAFLWMLTGERPVLKKGVLQPIKPIKAAFKEGSGGIGLAFRVDRFMADESVYDHLIVVGNSVREANARSIALNWYINSYIRFVMDYTRTSFDEPLLIDRDALTGLSIYSDREDVFTARFQVAF